MRIRLRLLKENRRNRSRRKARKVASMSACKVRVAGPFPGHLGARISKRSPVPRLQFRRRNVFRQHCVIGFPLPAPRGVRRTPRAFLRVTENARNPFSGTGVRPVQPGGAFQCTERKSGISRRRRCPRPVLAVGHPGRATLCAIITFTLPLFLREVQRRFSLAIWRGMLRAGNPLQRSSCGCSGEDASGERGSPGRKIRRGFFFSVGEGIAGGRSVAECAACAACAVTGRGIADSPEDPLRHAEHAQNGQDVRKGRSVRIL